MLCVRRLVRPDISVLGRMVTFTSWAGSRAPFAPLRCILGGRKCYYPTVCVVENIRIADVMRANSSKRGVERVCKVDGDEQRVLMSARIRRH